jgi:hypothetical protein
MDSEKSLELMLSQPEGQFTEFMKDMKVSNGIPSPDMSSPRSSPLYSLEGHKLPPKSPLKSPLKLPLKLQQNVPTVKRSYDGCMRAFMREYLRE